MQRPSWYLPLILLELKDFGSFRYIGSTGSLIKELKEKEGAKLRGVRKA